ncbi:MAG: hypothetical protein ACF8SC_09170 [Phycisphaerales bacterium JB037]
MGQVNQKSHRYIANAIGRRHIRKPFSTMEEVAAAFAKEVWQELENVYSIQFRRARELAEQDAKGSISSSELRELEEYRARYSGGYCIAGRVEQDLECSAYTVEWAPDFAEPEVAPVPREKPVFWGVPFFMERLIYGFDSIVLSAIFNSGHWQGSLDELTDIVAEKGELIRPEHLPLREAVDWIHTVIYTTIRSVKFAKWQHYCGGPIELATITCDRPFRWIRHKPLDAAVRPVVDMRLE